MVLPAERQEPVVHRAHAAFDVDDEPPADHVPTGHSYAGAPAEPGQKLPAKQAVHVAPLRKNPALHEAVPTKATPAAPSDHTAPLLALARPSSMQRLGDAS